jgi:hypothetical protein
MLRCSKNQPNLMELTSYEIAFINNKNNISVDQIHLLALKLCICVRFGDNILFCIGNQLTCIASESWNLNYILKLLYIVPIIHVHSMKDNFFGPNHKDIITNAKCKVDFVYLFLSKCWNTKIGIIEPPFFEKNQ